MQKSFFKGIFLASVNIDYNLNTSPFWVSCFLSSRSVQYEISQLIESKLDVIGSKYLNYW